MKVRKIISPYGKSLGDSTIAAIRSMAQLTPNGTNLAGNSKTANISLHHCRGYFAENYF
jgi:hypothetical protein